MLPQRHVKPATCVISNCCITAQCNTLRRKCYLASSTSYMSSQTPTDRQVKDSMPSLPPRQHSQFGIDGIQTCDVLTIGWTLGYCAIPEPFHHTIVCLCAPYRILCEECCRPYSALHYYALLYHIIIPLLCFHKVCVFTIVEECSLREAEFMAVLRLAGIHGFGLPVIISEEVS